MATVVNETTNAVAWLESVARDGQEAIRAELSRFPFVVGRNESCDLPLNSARVSREHLRIEQGPNGFLVRDLGSTNGTFLNGTKITEAPLADGDLLTVASFGLVFRLPKSAAGSTATQTMTQFAGDNSVESSSHELVETLRALQEARLARAVRSRIQAIVSIETGEPVAYELTSWSLESMLRRVGEHSQEARRAVARANLIGRTVAVEQACHCYPGLPLFLPVEAGEVESLELLDSLERLKQQPTGEVSLVVQISHEMLGTKDRFNDFVMHCRDVGLAVCVDGFAAAATMLRGLGEHSPDYVKLPTSLVQGLTSSPDQRRRVQEIVSAAEEAKIRVIARGVEAEPVWSACKNARIDWVQGEYVAAAMPLDACSVRK